jgi:phosphoribosylformylglycinamidine synthase PurS subunit
MAVRIDVEPRPGVYDPEARAVLEALRALGFAEVSGVRVGRYFEVEGEVTAERAAEMARRLLANPVTQQAVVRAPEPSEG